jgi:hypothetical protein
MYEKNVQTAMVNNSANMNKTNNHLSSMHTVELVQSDTWVFWHPVTSDKHLWYFCENSDILYNPTHFTGPLVCPIRQAPLYIFFCACPKPGSGLSMSYVVVFFLVFSELRRMLQDVRKPRCQIAQVPLYA